MKTAARILITILRDIFQATYYSDVILLTNRSTKPYADLQKDAPPKWYVGHCLPARDSFSDPDFWTITTANNCMLADLRPNLMLESNIDLLIFKIRLEWV
jgi:hypothetical protein